MSKIKQLNFFLILIVLFFSIVLPNSSKVFVLGLMLISFCISFMHIQIQGRLKLLFGLFFLSVLTTFFYIILGMLNGSPSEAVKQVIFVYVLSPLLWLVILVYFVQNFSEKQIIHILAYFSIMACISVGIYFYLFLNYGAGAISFFGSKGNVNMSNTGYSAAIMHVFGSLIFLGGGFFLSPAIIESIKLRSLVLLLIFIVVIFAGRTALTVAVFLSLTMASVIVFLKVISHKYSAIKFAAVTVFSVLAFALLVFYINASLGVDFLYIIERFAGKIAEGGGGERVNQAHSLIKGIENSPFIGQGHGVGVEYVRSSRFPWRYELVWLATIFRTGIIGAFIYSLPHLMYLITLTIKAKQKQLNDLDKFFFGAWFAVFVASNTNPYIEAFSFQWMYILPLVFFFNKSSKQP